MRASFALRAGAALGAAALVTFAALPREAESQSNFVQDGGAGFIVTQFGFVLARDSEEIGSCPDGRAQSYGAIAADMPEGARQDGEDDSAYAQRIRQMARTLMVTEDGQGACLNPQDAPAVPHHSVTGQNVVIDGGLDLDGQVSRSGGRPAAGTCAHDDFRGASGETGIDNQFYRVVGCINAYQPTGPIGEGGGGNNGAILISLSGIDDIRNDDEVEVGIYANADPIQLSPNREALPHATYAMTQNPQQRSTTTGRIVNGVLTTDLFDFRMPHEINAMLMERTFRDMRIRATIAADGAIEGYMGGYTMVEDIYNAHFSFSRAVDADGMPARRRAGSAAGAAGTLGYTCQGVYASLLENADGHRDPETGRCTSISTQYRFRAIPAFLVDVETRGANDDLVLSAPPSAATP